MGRTGIRISLLASLLVAGCGSVKDSGAIDAGGDAGPDADESGEVTVLTKAALFGQAQGAVIADVDVISTLPNNMPFATGKTGANGMTTIKVVPGGTVTAAYKHTSDAGFDFISFVDVKPGDTLEFGNRAPQATISTDLGTFNYSWPSLAGATSGYRILTSCNTAFGPAGSTGAAANEFSECHKEPMDVMFTAQAAGNSLANCSFRSNVAFTAGGTTSIGSWVTAGNATATITGIPQEVFSLSTTFNYVLDGTRERAVTGGGQANGAPSGGAFTGNFLWCATGERTLASLSMSQLGSFSSTRVLDSLPPNALSWTVANPSLPPWVEGTILTSAVNREFRFVTQPTSGMSAHDATVAALTWNVGVNTAPIRSQWAFILPPSRTLAAMPKLPASFEDVLPRTTCTPAPTCLVGMSFQSIRTIEIPTVADYDAARKLPSSTLMCPECAVKAGEIQRIIQSGFGF